MIKMIIKMNDDRLKNQTEYSPDRVYSALDRIFKKKKDYYGREIVLECRYYAIITVTI